MPATSRGRIDKREAILDAAFTVFAREGYTPATVDAIAAEAKVAKHTVYSHFRDKKTLLQEAIAAEADRALAKNLAVVERLREPGDDLRAALEGVGDRLLECYCDSRSWALRRLLFAEVGQFPELLEIIRGRAFDPVTEALADRFARLALAGRLRTAEPAQAAEQYAALLTGSMDNRARLGTREVPAAELRQVARDAVSTFLAAFGPVDRPAAAADAASRPGSV